MRRIKILIYLGILISFSIGVVFLNHQIVNETISSQQNENSSITKIIYDINPKTTSSRNYDNIEELFNAKYDDYNSLGYFPQIYESSLQATYYALYILDAIGKLDQINQTAVINYIMNQYDINSGIFMDMYALRYLDTDIELDYYPLTSYLEVNCYATLSLAILGRLDLIDQQMMIDFIWSCQYPGAKGFIGQPYNTNLDDFFKVSFMDNTYYAIQTYDILKNGDWSLRQEEKDDLIEFIKSLQSTEPSNSRKGGYYNNNSEIQVGHRYEFLTMFTDFAPDIFSAYYSIKSLEIFGQNALETVIEPDFSEYLGRLYRQNNHFVSNYFGELTNEISPYAYKMNLPSTAMGIELSDIMEYTGINREGSINFILNNKNTHGGWDNSHNYSCYELIDTFEVIRSLKNMGELSRLSESDKNSLVSYIDLYRQYKGYSVISKDYISLELINSIVNSYDLYNRIFDEDRGLNTTEIYDMILRTVTPKSYPSFYACSHSNSELARFRSYPIEYNTLGNYNYIDIIGTEIDHKDTYMGLDTLDKTLKIVDFAMTHNLNDILENIIDSQFLNISYDNFGAFLPSKHIMDMYEDYPEIQNKRIFFEYTYYAIKSLEFLVSYLGIGEVKDLSFNKDALFTFIENHFSEYFDPHYSDKDEVILQNTYYMVYIYDLLDASLLTSQKVNNIKDFIIQNIDYTKIKNLYYCYKLSEALNLDLAFDLNASNNLVNKLYSEKYNEYYISLNRNTLDQEIFMWICDMAQNDDISIIYECDSSVQLGDSILLNVSLQNIVLNYFGPLITVKFESEQLGTQILELKSNSVYQENITIPNDFKDPLVMGNITVYESGKKVSELEISFNIAFNSNENSASTVDDDDDIQDSIPESNVNAAIPLVITIIAIPSCIIALSTKLRQRSITESKDYN